MNNLRSYNILIAIFLYTVVSISCEKDNYQILSDQPVLFQFNYINYAWGYQHTGWFIDPYGSIHGYNLPNKWVFPESDGYISKIDLLTNLRSADKEYVYRISSSELATYTNLIIRASNGAISDLVNAACDAGVASYNCYIWDTGKQKYKAVLLKQDGDFEQKNTSKEAEKITDWLEEISQIILAEGT